MNEATLIGFRLLIAENGDLMIETTDTPYEALKDLDYETRTYIAAVMSAARRVIQEAKIGMEQEVYIINEDG